MGRDVPNAEIAALQRAAEHQVDLVEATVLDRRIKAFLRRVPVVVDTGSGAGSHYDGGDRVTIAVADPNDVRPILLHESMHVYRIRILPGGVTNPDIPAFYGRARVGSTRQVRTCSPTRRSSSPSPRASTCTAGRPASPSPGRSYDGPNRCTIGISPGCSARSVRDRQPDGRRAGRPPSRGR